MGITISIGTALEIVGVGVTAVGVWATWRHFALPQDRFVGPALDLGLATAGAVRARLATWARRLLRRPSPTIVGVGASTFGLTGVRARVRVGYGQLPPDNAKALEELHRRTVELKALLSGANERLDDQVDDLRKVIESIRKDLAAEIDRVNARSQQAALDGLRTEAVGLLLIAAGVLLQGWTITV